MNKTLFKLISRKLRNAGLPITRETIELVWNEIQEKTAAGFALLESIRAEVIRPAEEIYESVENWSVSKKAPMAPLGAGNPAFPAGYFDSFTGKLSNGQVEME